MTEQKLKDYTDVLLGKARVVRAKKAPTTEERIANRAVVRNRAVVADMTAPQRRAAILRGCL